MTDSNRGKHTVFCVMGRTSSGKSSIVRKAAQELDKEVLQSYTTRKPRKEEIACQNSDHIFINDNEFKLINNNEEIIAYTEINNNKYFSTIKQLGLSDFYVIDPDGFDYLLETVDKNKFNLVPIYIKASYKTRLNRYIDRDDTIEELFVERNNSETSQFDRLESNLESYKNLHIINNDIPYSFEDAVADLEVIVLETTKNKGIK